MIPADSFPAQVTDFNEYSPRKRRSRRRGHGRRRRPSNQLRAWADVLDGLLTAIEQTAWSTREVAGAAREAWSRGERDVASARENVVGWSEHATRLSQTGWMLARVAAGYRLHGLRSAFVTRQRATELLDELHATSARRFHDVSSVHGGAFMKVGQMLSARSDLLPRVWIDELTKLQDAAPAIPFSDVRRVVEESLGAKLEELFASFEGAPLAAASIGQVHRATTKDGTVVAVKVQRPGIEGRVRLDLQLLETFVSSLQSSLPETDYDTIVTEVKSKILSEVDYVAEASATERAADFFADHPGIVVPRPVAALSSDRVLTTTFVAGEKITDVLDALDARVKAGDVRAHAELSSVLGNLLEAYLRQVLLAGMFQADPHPGNLLVTPEGKVVVLDFGCAQVLTPEVRDRYLALVGAFFTGDRERMTELFREIGFVTRSGRPDTLHAFADALLGEIRQMAAGSGVAWPSREEFVAKMTDLLAACNGDPVMSLPGEFIMIARVFGTLGGLFATYRPAVDFTTHILPVVGRALF